MKVCVIGGGAAGMMAAISAAQNNHDVTLLEKNEKTGKKLFITGKGRCNVTNDSDADTFFRNVNKNPKFLFSSYYGFDSSSVMNFFEENGCDLKTERGNRVFPLSDHSSDILKVLNDKLKKLNVKIRLNTRVEEIIVIDKTVQGIITDKGEKLSADKVILATGGASYPLTGSTGDGYKMAKKLGHTVTDISPSLIPFECFDSWIPNLMGLSLKNVELSLMGDSKVYYKELGEMLFTHFGISGPLVLSASAFYEKAKEKSSKVSCKIDLKPALSNEELDLRIQKDFAKYNNKNFNNSLNDLLPAGLIPVIVELSKINPVKKVNEVTREERLNLTNLLKNLPINIKGLRPIEEAIITRGGINVKEINASTMESKIVEGLSFAGEIIDVDAMTGGFNLQIAWSTGYLAGNI